MADWYVTPTGNNSNGGTSEVDAWATPGYAATALDLVGASGDKLWIKEGTYQVTATTPNMPNGPVDFSILTARSYQISGYKDSIGDNAGRFTLQAVGVDPAHMIYLQNSTTTQQRLINAHVIGNSTNTTYGIRSVNSSYGYCYNSIVDSCNNAFYSIRCVHCNANNALRGFNLCYGSFNLAVGCTTQGFFGTHGQNNSVAQQCNRGFEVQGGHYTNCVAVDCTNDGFLGSVQIGSMLTNCISYGNGGYGFYNTSDAILVNCASGNNTSGRQFQDKAWSGSDINPILLGSDPFIDRAGGDFSLNDNPGGGDLCRSAGIVTFGQLSTPSEDLGAIQTFIDTSGGSPAAGYIPRLRDLGT